MPGGTNIQSARPENSKPALAFDNSANPGEPNYVTFDDVRRAEDGRMCLILNLEDQSDIEERKSRFLRCMTALEQNDEFLCMVLLKEIDHDLFSTLSQQWGNKLGGALHRTQFACD